MTCIPIRVRASGHTFAALDAAVTLQRLLWELEGNLAFTAPTVDQFRNPHTLMKDFLDEDDLYKRAGDLVEFLIAWKPSAGATLPIMMVDLAQVRNPFSSFHRWTEP